MLLGVLSAIFSVKIATTAAQVTEMLTAALRHTEHSVTIQVDDHFTCQFDQLLAETLIHHPYVRSYLTEQAWTEWQSADGAGRYVQFFFRYSDPAAAEKKIQAVSAAEKLLNCLIAEEMTTSEKTLLLHDALLGRCTYAKTDSADAHTAYGALCENTAVCEGYAEAYALLLELCGIPNQLVMGIDRIGEHHVWNLVQIDDAWYHVDVTWDDRDPLCRYRYFLCNDAALEQDHSWDKSAYPIAETSPLSAEMICLGLREHGADYMHFSAVSHTAFQPSQTMEHLPKQSVMHQKALSNTMPIHKYLLMIVMTGVVFLIRQMKKL